MKKIKSFTLLVLFGFAAVGLSISSARAHVTLNVDGGGNLVGAQYVDVDKARHMVAGDRNDIFTEAVLGFLQEIRPQMA